MPTWYDYHRLQACQPELKLCAGTLTLGTSPAKTAGKGYTVSYTATGEFDVTLSAGSAATVISAVATVEENTVDAEAVVRIKEVVGNVVTFVTGIAGADSALTSGDSLHFQIVYSISSLSKV